jgi:threonine dehydratase
VALAAQRLGCKAVIVMPVTTPQIKINAVAARGAEVVLAGDSYDEAYRHALELEKKRRLSFVHPYDDPDVIAGQGTIGMEILRQHTADPRHLRARRRRRPDRRHRRLRQAAAAGDQGDRRRAGGGRRHGALARRRPPRAPESGRPVRRRRGGEAGRRGDLPLCKAAVDAVILVDTDAICAAIKDVFEDTRSILEPAGALAIAGAKAWAAKHKLRNETLVAVASGANTNFDRLRFVAERAEVGEHREAVLAVTIPETPGSFRKFCRLLGARNITEFNYRFADPREAHVFVGVQVGSRASR